MDMFSEVGDAGLRSDLVALADDRVDPPDAAIRRIEARGPSAVPALLAALAEDALGGVAHARILAILVRVDPSRALGPVRRAVADPRSHVRWAARTALAAVPGPEATEALIELLWDPSADVVADAARLLGSRRDSSAVTSLSELLARPEILVRYAAARALGEIGGPDALAAIAEQLPREEDPEVRAVIEGSLPGPAGGADR
jgi:HEAT repeat protein